MRPWWQSNDNVQRYSFGERLAAGLWGILGFVTLPVWLTAIHLPACTLVATLIATPRFVLADAHALLPFALAYDAVRLVILKKSGHLTGRIDRIILVDTSWHGGNEVDRRDAERAAARFGRFSTLSVPRLSYCLASAPLIAGFLALGTAKMLGADTNQTQAWALKAADQRSLLRPMFGGEYDRILAQLQASDVGPVRRYLWLLTHDVWLVTFVGAMACALTVSLKDDPRTEVYGHTALFDIGISDDGVRNMALVGGGVLMAAVALCGLALMAAMAPEQGHGAGRGCRANGDFSPTSRFPTGPWSARVCRSR